MPFPMKIQPIDSDASFNVQVKPVAKSRFKRLFERQFQSFLRISSSEKPESKDASNDLEPSSVCLAKMVQSFIEESNDKQCGINRCNCFHGHCNDSSDDELDLFGGFTDSVNTAPSRDPSDILKNLVSCENATERNILADTSKIVEMNKICKPKDDFRTIVTEGLIDLGYDASVCKSRWEKSSSYPAGDYEYIDVIVKGERLIIDIDFRSEFEIARSTTTYRTILQHIPVIFVGKSDRLQQIVSIVSEGAKQSLKKKGMHFPPWRKAEYMRAKWLSPFARTTTTSSTPPTPTPKPVIEDIESKFFSSSIKSTCSITTTNFSGEQELIFGEFFSLNAPTESPDTVSISDEEEKIKVVVSPWQPPAIKPKNIQRGGKVVTGLASILKD